MADKMRSASEVDLLPVRQRIAWMAVAWLLSASALALVSWATGLWLLP